MSLNVNVNRQFEAESVIVQASAIDGTAESKSTWPYYLEPRVDKDYSKRW